MEITDVFWSEKTYSLDQIVEEKVNCILFDLQDGRDRVLVPDELMKFPEDTQVPPE